MDILVCVKQVPETDARITISDDGRSVVVPDTAYRMNRLDACALEAALRLKASARQSVTIHAVTVGPLRADAVLRRAMGLGADAATHLVCEDDPFLSPLILAHGLARWAGTGRFDLVLCGTISEDLMQGCTGPYLAECLGFPVACAVMSASWREKNGTLEVEKEAEDGLRIRMTMPLPAVLTIQSGVYTPRYPALSRMLRAAAADIEILPLPVDGEAGQRIDVVTTPPVKAATRFLNGSASSQARALMDLITQRGLI